MSFDLDAQGIRRLLDDLDQRLRTAGIGATLYIVGGAAIALHLPDSGRRTHDIDGITTDERVTEIAAQMADELGLAEGWLNDAARPSPPRHSLQRPLQGCEFSWRPWSTCSQ